MTGPNVERHRENRKKKPVAQRPSKASRALTRLDRELDTPIDDSGLADQFELIDPWDRQPGEPPRSYTAFLAYRDMPAATRSVKATLPVVYGADCIEGTPGFAARWSNMMQRCSKWSWVNRAVAWDRQQSDLLQRELIDDLVEMRRRHAAIANVAVARAAERLRGIDATKLTVRELIDLLDVGVKIERQARGEADQIHQITGPAGGALQIEQHVEGEVTIDATDRLAAVAAALEEAGVLPPGSAAGIAALTATTGVADTPAN